MTGAPSCRTWAAIVASPLRRLWKQWWLLTVLWYGCAIFTTAALKHASQKDMTSMTTMVANLVIGWPLVAPFALLQGLRPLQAHWHQVLFIAVLAGLEKNLTNSSLYSIGASLKTALHTFNVIFTFFLAAFLGVDEASRWCICHCHCRGSLWLALAVALVVGGGVVTAACEGGADMWNASSIGILLQLGSSLAYAMKIVVIKMLLGDTAREDMYLSPSEQRPSTVHIAFIANPVIGVVSLAFLPVFERSWELPRGFWGTAAAVAVSITGILLFQLRLTQLTSPLTVAVLGVLKDVFTVLFFLKFGGEDFNRAQGLGFAVSALGVLVYACAMRGGRGLPREDTSSSFGSAVEQCSFSSEGRRGGGGGGGAGALAGGARANRV